MPLIVLVAWAIGWVLLWRLPRLSASGPTPPATGPETVTVVIPARDEADRLPLLLRSLTRQERPAEQIVVVDDGSRDGTGEVAATVEGVEVITAAPPPAGWSGKTWACTTGVEAARGDVLVFLDADVELAPDALSSLLATWRARGGLLSVQPHHHVVRPVEVLSLPFNVVAMMGIGVGSLVPPRRGWAAAGPCLVTDRADYAAVGGHSSVREDVAEDLALARRYRDEGLPVRCLAGGELVRFRMYRDLVGLVEGWRKNLASGARHTPRLRALGVGVWVTGLLVAAGMLPGVLGPASEAGPALLAYAAVAFQVAWHGRQVGRFGPAALAWPVLLAAFVVVFGWSSISTFVTRKVRWSGRTLDLRVQR